MQRTLVCVVSAVTAVAAVAGCGSGKPVVVNPPASAQAPATADLSATAEPAPLPAPPGGPIAGQRVQVHSDGASLQVDLTGLTRQGELITLTWDITMVEQNAAGAWYVGTRMSDDNITGYDVSAVSLVDPVNAKRYLVARSGGEDGECVCSKTSSDPLAPGDASSFFATFTAPPPEVTQVDVELKSLGAFSGVPIS
ncbi:hypothetical protein [Pseudonocardia humida]|uniref:Uncharacterized protein n=1 Tax=Pseudonocardia humida TaxID=2800819 RepID=A0ABT1ADS9_9PSEU|nr:hypothetical protein [Pseudonocardia humida]MCO1660914.1 hypothetical protein [Pseudonocardia humida]